MTAADLVAEVVAFQASPDLDRIRPTNQSSSLYLSWLNDRPNVPKLALVHGLDPQAISLAASELAERGVELEPVRADGRFAVVLEGPRYAGLLAADRLRNAATWLVEATKTFESGRAAVQDLEITGEELCSYLAVGGSPDDPEYQRVRAAVAALQPMVQHPGSSS